MSLLRHQGQDSSSDSPNEYFYGYMYYQGPKSSSSASNTSTQTSSQFEYPLITGPYTLEKKIGSGAFGSVHICKHRHTNKKYAGKLFERASLKDDIDMVFNEVEILKSLGHNHTISFVDVQFCKEGLLLVMELVEGQELLEMVPVRVGSYESLAKVIFHQLLQAVDYLHSLGIAHRDLKLENVMVDKRGNVKLVDYGLACIVPEEILESKGMIVVGICGTEHNYSPELIQAKCEDGDGKAKKEFYGDKVDIWALGVVLFEMATGKRLFEGSSEMICEKITTFDFSKRNDDFSPELNHLLRSIFQQDPLKRASIEKLLKHPWLKPINYENRAFIKFLNPTRTLELNLANRLPKARATCPKNFFGSTKSELMERRESFSSFRTSPTDFIGGLTSEKEIRRSSPLQSSMACPKSWTGRNCENGIKRSRRWKSKVRTRRIMKSAWRTYGIKATQLKRKWKRVPSDLLRMGPTDR